MASYPTVMYLIKKKKNTKKILVIFLKKKLDIPLEDQNTP